MIWDAILVQQHWELELVTESQLGEAQMKPPMVTLIKHWKFTKQLNQAIHEDVPTKKQKYKQISDCAFYIFFSK